jgi:glutamate-5-semialdehyde dehydrogenase
MNAPATADISALMLDMGKRARAALPALQKATAEDRTKALHAMAAAIRAHAAEILAANAADMEQARANNLDAAMLDRLLLDPKRVEGMAAGVETVANIPDPVGAVMSEWTRPNGMKIARVRVPLGVIGIIYESRPNVTADAGALSLRAGNACILRGGSESTRSSRAIHAALAEGLRNAGLPEDAIQIVPVSDRAAVGEMLKGLNGAIDIIVPRGGKGLVGRVQEEARVPTISHLDGNCHTYIHAAADPDMALAITLNAKMRRTGICGATETLLIDAACAPVILPKIAAALQEKGCELRGDGRAQALVPSMNKATEEDWATEYLAPILAVRVVDNIDEAIQHIAKYGSSHTEAIVTQDEAAAEKFLNDVDSAIILWNASTQFADGGEFGFGAEIGIATGRLHARGPVGAEQLTTFKYQIRGSGQIRP